MLGRKQSSAKIQFFGHDHTSASVKSRVRGAATEATRHLAHQLHKADPQQQPVVADLAAQG